MLHQSTVGQKRKTVPSTSDCTSDGGHSSDVDEDQSDLLPPEVKRRRKNYHKTQTIQNDTNIHHYNPFEPESMQSDTSVSNISIIPVPTTATTVVTNVSEVCDVSDNFELKANRAHINSNFKGVRGRGRPKVDRTKLKTENNGQMLVYDTNNNNNNNNNNDNNSDNSDSNSQTSSKSDNENFEQRGGRRPNRLQQPKSETSSNGTKKSKSKSKSNNRIGSETTHVFVSKELKMDRVSYSRANGPKKGSNTGSNSKKKKGGKTKSKATKVRATKPKTMKTAKAKQNQSQCTGAVAKLVTKQFELPQRSNINTDNNASNNNNNNNSNNSNNSGSSSSSKRGGKNRRNSNDNNCDDSSSHYSLNDEETETERDDSECDSETTVTGSNNKNNKSKDKINYSKMNKNTKGRNKKNRKSGSVDGSSSVTPNVENTKFDNFDTQDWHWTEMPKVFSKNEINNEFPQIFDWNLMTQAKPTEILRSEAIRKQARTTYVKQANLNDKEAQERRRAQNRRSAKRTRERIRRYVTVLEMHYSHLVNVNKLLTDQLKIASKEWTKKDENVTKTEKKNVKKMSWPKPPSLQECVNAKPAQLLAASKKLGTNNNNNNNNKNSGNHAMEATPSVSLPTPEAPASLRSVTKMKAESESQTSSKTIKNENNDNNESNDESDENNNVSTEDENENDSENEEVMIISVKHGAKSKQNKNKTKKSVKQRKNSAKTQSPAKRNVRNMKNGRNVNKNSRKNRNSFVFSSPMSTMSTDAATVLTTGTEDSKTQSITSVSKGHNYHRFMPPPYGMPSYPMAPPPAPPPGTPEAKMYEQYVRMYGYPPMAPMGGYSYFMNPFYMQQWQSMHQSMHSMAHPSHQPHAPHPTHTPHALHVPHVPHVPPHGAHIPHTQQQHAPPLPPPLPPTLPQPPVTSGPKPQRTPTAEIPPLCMEPSAANMNGNGQYPGHIGYNPQPALPPPPPHTVPIIESPAPSQYSNNTPNTVNTVNTVNTIDTAHTGLGAHTVPLGSSSVEFGSQADLQMNNNGMSTNFNINTNEMLSSVGNDNHSNSDCGGTIGLNISNCNSNSLSMSNSELSNIVDNKNGICNVNNMNSVNGISSINGISNIDNMNIDSLRMDDGCTVTDASYLYSSDSMMNTNSQFSSFNNEYDGFGSAFGNDWMTSAPDLPMLPRSSSSSMPRFRTIAGDNEPFFISNTNTIANTNNNNNNNSNDFNKQNDIAGMGSNLPTFN